MALFENLIHLVARHLFAALSIIALCSTIFLFAYRLYFHPLASFPGPKLAAISIWYEFYYDAIKRGQYTFEIGCMHEKYGPIIRISPNELHVNDPAFIDTLYAGGGKQRDKYKYFTAQFGIPESVFATVSHNHHRLRRGALNRFFSKASVTKIEPVIAEVVQKLCSQVQKHAGSGRPVTLSSAFSCMTTDVVTEYAFARSYDFLSTDSPAFETNLHEAILAGSEIGLFVKQFPWMHHILQALPESVLENLNPTMRSYLQFQKDMRAQIKEVQDGIGEKSGKAETTIFHELLNGSLPEQEKTVARLWQEGQIIVGAGTETTAWTLSVIMYYVLLQPDTLKVAPRTRSCYSRLSTTSVANKPRATPILDNAIISEGLRLSYGVSTRSQRVSPHEPLFFKSNIKPTTTSSSRQNENCSESKDWIIPPGTPVGMTAVLIHHNEGLFPNSNAFIPERWLDKNGHRRRDLEGYLLSFSKGSPQCLGINLAYAEVYMALAAVIRTFGDRLELFETTAKDVEICHDVFVPVPKAGSKGIRVLVRQE